MCKIFPFIVFTKCNAQFILMIFKCKTFLAKYNPRNFCNSVLNIPKYEIFDENCPLNFTVLYDIPYYPSIFHSSLPQPKKKKKQF